jgi:hypothetical protein
MDVHTLLIAIGNQLHEVLANSTDEELYALNAETYSLYSMVFGELKMRVAKNIIRQNQIQQATEDNIKQLIRTRFEMSGIGD